MENLACENASEAKKKISKKIKSKTMLIQHIKGYPYLSMYSKNEGGITSDTDRETPCIPEEGCTRLWEPPRDGTRLWETPRGFPKSCASLLMKCSAVEPSWPLRLASCVRGVCVRT